MFKKVVSAIMVAAMVGTMVAPVSVSAKDGGKTIELWTCWTEGADTEKASQEMIQKWEEETGNTVNQTNFTYDMLHEKILTAAAGGNVPDLIWGLPEYVGEFYNMGIVADLTDKFNEWEDKDALSDSVVNAMTIDNKVIGIPYEMTVRAYLVHDDDLKTAGIETPATWEDLLAQSDYYDNNGKYLTGEGLDWMKKYGEKELLNEISGMDDNAKPVAVIFNLGVNDLIHKNRESISYDSVASDYASYMNGLSRKLTARNCELFYMSVNPCNTAMKSTRKESEIRGFNNRLRQRLNGNFTWINSYSYLMRCGYTTRCEFRGYTDDGVHYSMRTYKRIYAYAIKQIR